MNWALIAILVSLFFASLAFASNHPGSSSVETISYVPGSFTLAILPDTQWYTDIPEYATVFNQQTQWLADQKAARNVAFVMHEGDMTNKNVASEWTRAKTAMDILKNASVPFAVSTGNHDVSSSRNTLISSYFPTTYFDNDPTYGGSYSSYNTDNNYHLFSAGGKDFVAVSLEWAPRNEVVTWADGIFKQHSDRIGIVVTHAYTYSDDTRYDWAAKGASQQWSPYSYGMSGSVNDGQDLWNKLVEPNTNIEMVFSGHVMNDGTGRLESTRSDGTVVNQILANYQQGITTGDYTLGYDEGYLRLLEFLPDGQTVQVKTYSPYKNDWLIDSANQFAFTVTPEPASLALLGIGSAVLLRRRGRKGVPN